MPCCVAIGCSNSDKKGYLMKHFPRDPIRKKLWMAKIKRDKWTPSQHSCICEVHFEENMWEKTREDGSRRLKCNAFPTLFSFTKIIKQRKPPLERSNVPLAKINNLCTNEILTDSKTLSNNNSHIEREEEGQFNCNQNNMEKYNKICSKLWVNANKYKIMYYNTTKKLKAAEMIIQNQKNRLSSIFNNDQMKALSKKSTMFMKWSNETVKKALKLKFACGNNGYNEILSQNIPLPSLRTLRRRLQNLKFDSGILDEVYDFLKIKVESFKCEYERECVLIMDEMAITPTSLYDTSLNKYIGNVTLPKHKGVATNVMVFMLGGITSRWKQTVGYYFTGKSVNGIVYDRIIKDIIAKSEEIGLKIVSIISDMGSSNQALWRNWNIQAKQHSEVRNSIPHPYDSTRKIYIVPDPVHLFKNMKNMLMTNKVLTITDDIKKKYNLPTRDICAQHILDVVNYQKNLKFQLAPKLTEQDLFPNHFQKMKVSKSTNVISHDVSSALRFLAEELHKPEYLTTAWYIEIIDKWFNLMTSRSPVMALSKLKPLVYEEAISFLNQFIDIMRKLKVGVKTLWKPSQSGSILATTSILQLQDIFLNDKGFKFLLTSRFTQDCLENLFCVLRSKNVVPNALQVKNNLKLVTVSQYLKDVSNGNCDEDERELLSGFLDVIQKPKVCNNLSEVKITDKLVEPHVLLLNNGELNSLYNICGYIIHSIKKKSKLCKNCLNFVGSNSSIDYEFTKLSRLKRFKKGCLFFCNKNTFDFFLKMEGSFQKFFPHIKDQNCDIKKFLIQQMNKIEFYIPECHNLRKYIINRFVIFRLKISGRKNSKLLNKYSSKSIDAHGKK